MDNFVQLPGDAVIDQTYPDGLLKRPMFRSDEFQRELTNQLHALVGNPKGVARHCKILTPGKDWKQGKYRYRVVIEFCPDEPEPLSLPPVDDDSLSRLRGVNP